MKEKDKIKAVVPDQQGKKQSRPTSLPYGSDIKLALFAFSNNQKMASNSADSGDLFSSVAKKKPFDMTDSSANRARALSFSNDKLQTTSQAASNSASASLVTENPLYKLTKIAPDPTVVKRLKRLSVSGPLLTSRGVLKQNRRSLPLIDEETAATEPSTKFMSAPNISIPEEVVSVLFILPAAPAN